MKINRKVLSRAIHNTLGFSAVMSVAMASGAVMAQDQQDNGDGDSAELDRIEVTGSRIKRANVESASPVTVLTREEIEKSGYTDVGDLLQSIPSMSGSPIGTTTNNGGNGTVNIDLRGMGSARTLTLVNGKRVVDGGDFQAIPATMIERVEILKDGASAVYGADAVAGVVNIITRRDFTGVEATAQRSDWFDSAGSQDSFSLITGREFDRGNFVFGAEFITQEAAFQSDTPWDFMQNSFYIYPEGCENQVAAPYDGSPTGGCYPIGSSRIPESRLPFFSQGLFLIGTPATSPYEVGLMQPHDGRTYNYAPINYIQTPYERTNIFGEAHFDVTDNVRFNAEFRGNFRESAQQLAPLPFTGGDPMFNGFYDDPATGDTVAFTGISQDNYYLRRAIDAYNAANGTSLIYEPVVNPRRRMIETNRRFEQNITQYQWTAGFEGDISDTNMSWDVYINEGHRSNSSRDFGQFAGSRLFNALGPSADLDGDGQPECYADINNPSTLIVGCVPLNLFGGGQVDPATGQPVVTTLTEDMINYVSLDTVDSITQRQRTAGANLSGYNFELPGGQIGWSVGWSYWKQELAVTLDSAKTIGAVTGNVGASTAGTLTNNALYAELLVPVFDNGTQNIYLKGGARYDDWDAFGSDETYQLGLEVQALESLKLRATYGTVFRAPTISDLFGGQVDSFPQFTDPCAIGPGQTLPPGCERVSNQTDSQVHALVGGNPNLIPETGDTFTAGVVFTPSIGENNFEFIADYWKINLDKGISSLGVQFTLDECYENQSADACALITRNNDADFSINTILDAQLNVSKQTAEGIDFEGRWDYTTGFGRLSASVLWTHMLERTVTQFKGSEKDDLAGRYSDAAFAEDKANVSFGWALGDFTLTYLGEYISSLDADTFCNCGAGNQPDGTYVQDIPSQYYQDITGTFTFDSFGSTTMLTFGINNITDEAPPFIETGFNASTDPSTYRLFGRGYFARLKWSY